MLSVKSGLMSRRRSPIFQGFGVAGSGAAGGEGMLGAGAGGGGAGGGGGLGSGGARGGAGGGGVEPRLACGASLLLGVPPSMAGAFGLGWGGCCWLAGAADLVLYVLYSSGLFGKAKLKVWPTFCNFAVALVNLLLIDLVRDGFVFVVVGPPGFFRMCLCPAQVG